MASDMNSSKSAVFFLLLSQGFDHCSLLHPSFNGRVIRALIDSIRQIALKSFATIDFSEWQLLKAWSAVANGTASSEIMTQELKQ